MHSSMNGRVTSRECRADPGIGMPRIERVIAVLLLLLLTAAARGSDNSNVTKDASSVDMDLIFPDEEFSQLHSCLSLGHFTECIVYFTVDEYNITVEGVGEDGSTPETEDPCRYYICEFFISDTEGNISCRLQEKSEACNTKLEQQFLRGSSKNRPHSTCVVLFLSDTIGRFTFNEQVVSDSCNASCSCETPVATTHAGSIDMLTNTVQPKSTETNSTTTTTTTVVPGIATTMPSTGVSIENVSFANATKATSESVHASSTNNTLTIENIGNNATLVRNDKDETVTIVAPVFVCIFIVACGIVLAVFLLRRSRRRNADPQPADQGGLEMVTVYTDRPPSVPRRTYEDDSGQDSEADTPLISKEDLARFSATESTESAKSTESIAEYSVITLTAAQRQSAERDDYTELKKPTVDHPDLFSKTNTMDHVCDVQESMKDESTKDLPMQTGDAKRGTSATSDNSFCVGGVPDKDVHQLYAKSHSVDLPSGTP